jgi:hypothetical protein
MTDRRFDGGDASRIEALEAKVEQLLDLLEALRGRRCLTAEDLVEADLILDARTEPLKS